MRFLIALVVVLLLVIACARPLKRYPIPFYLGAVALVGLYFYGSTINATGGLWPYFMPLMQRCALAFLLFTLVMFVGVLDESSRLRTHLMPVRRQLSILGCIFAVGHVVFYAMSYLPRLATALTGNLGFSLALAALLVVLMAVLFVTSLQAVKHRLKAATWKGIQRLAYPFYLLIYVHLALLLLPSTLAGKDTAVISLVVYTVVMVAYVVLRTRKALAAKHTTSAGVPLHTPAQGSLGE